jgi:hypothetical protein
LLSIFNPEIFIRAGGGTERIIYGIDPGGGRAAVEPLEKGVQLFFGTFRPDFDITYGGVADPTHYTPQTGFMDTGIAKTNTLNTAPDTGETSGVFRGGRSGGLHKRPSS